MDAETLKLDGRSWALMLTLAFLFSVSFIFIKVAAAGIPILTLVLIRVGLAAAVLHVVVLATGRHYPTAPKALGRYAVMGVFNNLLPGILIVYATARIGAGSASILNATVPIFTLLIAHVATANEKITAAKLAGILLGFAGVAAMVGPQALGGLGSDVLAAAAMLVASASYGLSNTIGRGFGGIDPTVSATCLLIAATLMLTPIALLVERPWLLPAPSAAALFSAIGLALASTALAYVLFFRLIARAGATNTSLVALLIPAGGVFLAWAILGEALTWGEAAGMALIGLGLVVIDGRLASRWFERPAPGVRSSFSVASSAARPGATLQAAEVSNFAFTGHARETPSPRA